MDFHLERGLRLHTEPDYKSLYDWAINEIDARGQEIGHDQVPWDWTLHFTATWCVLDDRIDIKSQFLIEETKPTPAEVAQRQTIRVQLSPGTPRDGDYFRKTTFSMFGTDRAIKSFQLNIQPIADSAEQERCTAWGTVSYTADVDFLDETIEDCIVFYLFVKPETFARYAVKISNGFVDEMLFSVGSVSGFYSEWSPSISTRNVKVLTKGPEQKITLPAGLQFEPPRLGDIGAAELYINRRLEFGRRAPDPDAVVETADVGAVRAAFKMPPRAVDPRTLQMLGSLSRAAWFVVILLALIFVATLLKR